MTESLFLVALIAARLQGVSAQQAMQTGPSEGTHAYSLAYDGVSGEVIVTGLTYDEIWDENNIQEKNLDSCFLATFDYDRNLELTDAHVFGNSTIKEVCTGIALVDEDYLVLSGSARQNGIYFDQSENSIELSRQLGFVMVIDRHTGERIAGASLHATSESNYVTQIVQQVVFDSDSGSLYVTSVNSRDMIGIPESGNTTKEKGEFYSDVFGNQLELAVERFQLNLVTRNETDALDHANETTWQNSLARIWSKSYPVQPYFRARGLIYKPDKDLLIVTGVTEAGDVFTNAARDGVGGFVLVLDPATGELHPSRKNNERYGGVDVWEGDGDFVYISSTCDDPNDANAIYIVGTAGSEAFEGSFNNHDGSRLPFPSFLTGFIKKINLDTLQSTGFWTFQFGATKSGIGNSWVDAVGCAVFDDVVYVAGNIAESSLMFDATSPRWWDDFLPRFGKHDVWIAQLNGTSGMVNWMQQVGTAEDDKLGRNGAVVVDDEGNAIVTLNTNGTMYRQRASDGSDDNFDMVVLSFDKANGSYKTAMPEKVSALQTGPDTGPTIAGEMAYDASTNAVFITGSTYGTFAGPGAQTSERSNCVFGIIDLRRLEFQQRELFGNSNVPEACTAIDMNNFGSHGGVVIAGSSQPDGLMSQFTDQRQAQQHGFVMDLGKDRKYELVGGSTVGVTNINFPVAIAADTDTSMVFVASMTSDVQYIAPDFENVTNYRYFTSKELGSFSIEKLSMDRDSNIAGKMNEMEKTMNLVWNKPFETADLSSVHVSDMSLLNATKDILIVGTANVEGQTDQDGFLAKISQESGDIRPAIDGLDVTYFSSMNGHDDWILGSCVDPTDEDTFFIVGASKGVFAHEDDPDEVPEDSGTRAFVAKISTATLQPTWTKTLAAVPADGASKETAAVIALGCDVVPGKGHLYVAGTVENGATMSDVAYNRAPMQSAGNDDIWVAWVSTHNGGLLWLKQTGSNGNDRVARRGGVKADAYGNAVVFGDTTGDFYRIRDDDVDRQQSDLFVTMFHARDGSHVQPNLGPVQSALADVLSSDGKQIHARFVVAVCLIGMMIAGS